MKKHIVEGIGDQQSGGAVMTGTRWQGVVFFRPWMIAGGKVRKDMLRVLLPARASSSEAFRESKKVREGVAYRFPVALYPERKNLIPSGELKGKLVKLKRLEVLAEAEAKVTERIVVRDAVLGKLVREPRSTHFAGTLKMLGRSCELLVWGKEVAKASALVKRLRPKFATLPKRIASELVGLANRWRPDGAREVTEKMLASRLQVTDVSVDEDANKVRFSFDSGDTFTDHGVTATLDASGKAA